MSLLYVLCGSKCVTVMCFLLNMNLTLLVSFIRKVRSSTIQLVPSMFYSHHKRKKMLYSTQEHNTTTWHPGNLKSITPRGKSKIFLFACEHHSHFHPLANQTKSDQAIKRLSVTPRGAFSKLRRQHG